MKLPVPRGLVTMCMMIMLMIPMGAPLSQSPPSMSSSPLPSPSPPRSVLQPPPWTFPGARILYQPSFVRVSEAAEVTPGRADGLTLLSLFGYTLGVCVYVYV